MPICMDLPAQKSNFVIERLLPESEDLEDKIQDALSICDKYLGAGLYSRERIQNIIQRKHSYFFIALSGDQIGGIFCCYAAQFSAVARELECKKQYLADSEITGVCRSIALEREYRSSGLSEYLLNMACDILFKEENAKLVAVPAWIRKDSREVPAGNHLAACGFITAEIIPHPWRKYDVVRCTACNKCPCECDCVLYIKRRIENE